jgi:hypothetical protein
MIPRSRLTWLVVVVTAGSLLASTVLNADNYVTPYISSERYQKLVFVGKYLKDRGWTEPIYVSYGDPGIWFWSIDRSYIGIDAGLDYTYYGKLQDLFFVAPALNESSYHILPNMEIVTAKRNVGELQSRFGADIARIRDRPVVFIMPDSYSRALSEWFAPRYLIGNGVFVLPPGALTELEINRWRLFAAYDYTWKSNGVNATANWSVAPQILEVKNASAGQGFAVMYRFVTSLLVPFTIRVHIMDYPSSTGNGSVHAPLTLLLDGAPILTHSYGGNGTLWLATATSSLQTGVHMLTVASGAPGLYPVLGIDVIEIAPA